MLTFIKRLFINIRSQYKEYLRDKHVIYRILKIDLDPQTALIQIRGKNARFTLTIAQIMNDIDFIKNLSPEDACWIGFCYGQTLRKAVISGNDLKKNPPNSYLLFKAESPYRLVSVNREGNVCYIDSHTNKIFNENPIAIIQSDYIISKFDATHSAYIGMLGGIAYEKERERNRVRSSKLVVDTHNKKPSLRIVN